MIPEVEQQQPSDSTGEKDDIMLAGYKECATEALNWLLGLGYEPGHPLLRSLAAHLTKKQAYLEKLSLERFLIEESIRNFEEDFEEDSDIEESAYESCALRIKNNEEIQKALVDAVFKGCDLKYSENDSS